MSGNTADENTNRYPTTTEREITLEDVRQLEQGDAIGLRVAIKKDVYYIVAGRVSSEPASKAEIREQLEEYDTAEVVTLDLNLWWVLTDGELIDRSHRLEDRPPSRSFWICRRKTRHRVRYIVHPTESSLRSSRRQYTGDHGSTSTIPDLPELSLRSIVAVWPNQNVFFRTNTITPCDRNRILNLASNSFIFG